jgi:nonsense-mediated mRNA decay protein 3
MSRRPKPSKTQCELHLVFPFPSSLNLLPCSLCCECGSPIEPNPSNMCVACLRTKVDITEGIPKQVTLQFCRGCERYHNPPSEWVHCVLESKELLSLCLKKLKGLSRVKLVDAGFVWTEPHSKRIKVKLTVHGEVLGGAMLEQVFVVDYIVSHQMCDDCHRSEAQNFWRAVVQVRQKAENKKTFFYLEQLILKHKAHENTLGIKPVHDGLDFFYATEAHARKMVDFLTAVLPCKSSHSKKLISHDIHSNLYNYKFTYSVEIVPVSKDSLVCLPKKLTQQLGGISPLCLVYRVTSSVHLIDPSRAQITEMNSTAYWRSPFGAICNPKQLVEYVVMDIEPIMDKDRKSFPGQGAISNKHVLADIWVVKASELGMNDNTIHTRTHLGHVLKPGDYVLGYNLEDSNVNDASFDKLESHTVPDVVLVKKYYDRSERKRRRIWKLKHLAEEDTALVTDTRDYNEFLDDLEEDPDLRHNVNIFKDSTKQILVDSGDDVDEAVPRITLAEMLDDLVIDDVEMTEQ